MLNSILLEIIRALDKEELSELHKFLKSPFFNRKSNSDQIICLFEYIQHGYPNWKGDRLKKEVVYQHLFPHQKIIGGKLEKLMSALLKLTKDFLSLQYSDTRKDPAHKLLTLGRFYKEKRLGNRFANTIHLLKKELKVQGKDIQLYHKIFQADQLIAEYNSLHNKRKGYLNIQQTLESLDIYYSLSKLQITNILVLQNQFNAQPDSKTFALFSEILSLIHKGAYSDIPLIQIYYHMYFMLQPPHEEVHYQIFKTKLDEYADSFSSNLVSQFHTSAINYCILKFNKGEVEYLEEIFSLYQQYLTFGSLYYDRKLRPSTIKNIVNFGLQLKEFDWVQNFLIAHQDRITGTMYPEEVYQFNMAIYHFHSKTYEQALDLLSDTYEDVYYNLAARRLELKIYYEILSPLLNSRMDAFKALLFRLSKQTLSKEHKVLNNNFIDLLRQITHPKTFKNNARINKLIAKIQTTKQVSEKNWLLDKLERLKQ